MNLKLLISISGRSENEEIKAKDELRELLRNFRNRFKETNPGNSVVYSLLSSDQPKGNACAESKPSPRGNTADTDELDRAALKNYDQPYKDLPWEQRKIIKQAVEEGKAK